MSSNTSGLLTERRVTIQVSEPADLGQALSWQPLVAQILTARSDANGGVLLLQLAKAFTWKGTLCEHLVARPRHKGSSIDLLLVGSALICAITRIPPDRLDAPDPLDLGWWRGGVAFIGEIVPQAGDGQT